MELYEVEATRWYFSEVFYRVVAKDESDAFQRVHNMERGVVETSATPPQWNGEEEVLLANELITAHDMYPTDDIYKEHTNCQLIGTMWNCGHIDRQYYIDEAEEDKGLQLPLWPLDKTWNEDKV